MLRTLAASIAGQNCNRTPNSTCRSRLNPVVDDLGVPNAGVVVRPSATIAAAS
jgi:hypothetical protein